MWARRLYVSKRNYDQVRLRTSLCFHNKILRAREIYLSGTVLAQHCEDLSSLPSTASGEWGVHDGMYMQSQRRESRDMISISGASLASLLQGIGEFQACVCARMHTRVFE